tara:strand:- start:146 stop:547 length:402 start_codon:yes stop_codon:yes gene_type:complete
MNKDTLLGLISGGRFQQSEDLPTVKEFAHNYIDKVTTAFEESRQEPQQIVGTGLGLLDMVGGTSKAGAMIPIGTEKFQQLIKMLGRSKGDEILYNNQLLTAMKELQNYPSTLGSGFVKESTLSNIKNVRRGMK